MALKRCLLVAAGLAAAVFSSCSKDSLSNVRPPADPPLSRPVGYAVVVAPYAQVRDKPEADGVSLGYYRRGDIARIDERRSSVVDGKARVWLLNAGPEPGWIRGEDAEVYDSESRARTAASGGSEGGAKGGTE